MTGNEWLNTRFHGAFPFMVYAVLCLLAFGFVWKYAPETRNKTLEEMDDLWEAQLSQEPKKPQ
jgi:MFS transporter, SP family, xylose:H+ symportor